MKNAWVFPGQGSQKVGMLSDAAEKFEEVHHTFAEASEALGYDLWQLTQNDNDKLNQTEYTQPALLTASVAYWRIMDSYKKTQADFLAGHSLGEYSALVAAGAIAFADAVKLVSLRGQFMQSAVQPGEGAMAAILGLEDQVVVDICQACAEGEVLSAVNFNSPGQVVIAGQATAVDRALPVLKEQGARKVVPLPVSVPSHCALMKPAAEKLAQALTDIQIHTPQIPVIHNVDVAQHQDADAIRTALIEQLYKPVRWVETITYFAEQGVTRVVECGPGKVLTGLNKRMLKDAEHEGVAELLADC